MYYRIPTGTLGSGKSLISVYLAVTRYLKKGRIVCTNLDFYPEHFKDKWNKDLRIIRLPDHPTADDLISLPIGNPGLVEGPNGYQPGPNFNPRNNSLLLIDELAQHMNARDYNKSGRKDIVSQVVMLRKRGYDTIFIAQSYDMIDSQVRKSIGNEVGEGINMSLLPIPLIGWIGRFVRSDGEPFRFPSNQVRFTFYRVKRDNVSDLKTASYTVNINDYKNLYNTSQIFTADYSPGWAHNHHGTAGPHCLLTPWHLVGYKLTPPPSLLQCVLKGICLVPFYVALPLTHVVPARYWRFRA